MAMPYGVSFLPGTEAQQHGNGAGASRSPNRGVQEAVQILSLRLPKVYGTRPIAPAPLLTGPGGMGQPAAKGNVVAQALAQLAGLTPRQMPAPAPMAPMLPPAMALPMAPVLPTNPYSDWRNQERDINQPPSDSGGSSAPSPSAPAPSWPSQPPPVSQPVYEAPPPPRVVPGEPRDTPTPIPEGPGAGTFEDLTPLVYEAPQQSWNWWEDDLFEGGPDRYYRR